MTPPPPKCTSTGGERAVERFGPLRAVRLRLGHGQSAQPADDGRGRRRGGGEEVHHPLLPVSRAAHRYLLIDN